jgi:hypothetical protein
MKKPIILSLSVLFLSGCATYKFHYGSPPYNKGYVVSRDDYTILEYTSGKDNTVPQDLDLAKERFQRRRKIVEHYYKKMDYIENNFKKTFWNPPLMFLGAISGTLRLPSIIIRDFRYERNPKYKEWIDKRENEKDAREEAYLNKLREELNIYIQKDLLEE